MNKVDYRAELEEYEWVRARWESDKLIAASPFRSNDLRPSFFVGLETGGWHDSGATDPEYQSGNFTKLLGYLRGTNESEAWDYLRMKYGNPDDSESDVDEIPELKPLNLTQPEPYKPLDSGILNLYKFRHPYLTRRGISESVQRLMRIGYCRRSLAVTIPWFNPDGSLGNVMYRSVSGKTFWYKRGGRPITEMVYGLNIAYERRIARAVIVEAPIDALSVMTAGTLGIAVGGTAFSKAKRDAIIRSPIEILTIIRDNDAAGRLLQRRIIDELSPYMDVNIAVIPMRYGKDANDCGEYGIDTLTRIISRKRRVSVCKIRQGANI